MVVQSHRPLTVPKGGSQAVSVPSDTPMADIVARRIPIGLECVSVPLFLDPQIVDYLNKGVSKRSVAKILGCSPTTLYSWIRRRRISGR